MLNKIQIGALSLCVMLFAVYCASGTQQAKGPAGGPPPPPPPPPPPGFSQLFANPWVFLEDASEFAFDTTTRSADIDGVVYTVGLELTGGNQPVSLEIVTMQAGASVFYMGLGVNSDGIMVAVENTLSDGVAFADEATLLQVASSSGSRLKLFALPASATTVTEYKSVVLSQPVYTRKNPSYDLSDGKLEYMKQSQTLVSVINVRGTDIAIYREDDGAGIVGNVIMNGVGFCYGGRAADSTARYFASLRELYEALIADPTLPTGVSWFIQPSGNVSNANEEFTKHTWVVRDGVTIELRADSNGSFFEISDTDTDNPVKCDGDTVQYLLDVSPLFDGTPVLVMGSMSVAGELFLYTVDSKSSNAELILKSCQVSRMALLTPNKDGLLSSHIQWTERGRAAKGTI